MRIFCDVARQRSFSRGAELNGITQSAASQRIRALEEELGVELIDRSCRPLRLTPAGRIYYRGCRRILAQYEALKRQITDVAQPLRGRVTVAAIYSSDIALLNEIKESFETLHDGTHIQIRYLRPESVADQVRTGDADFGILSYPDRWRGMDSVVWRDEPMALVCRAGHRLTQRDGGIDMPELSDYEFVGLEPHLPISREILAYLRRQGVEPRIVSTFDNIDTIKTCLAGTDAIALLPERTVRGEIERGILVSFELKPTLARPVGIIHRRDRETSPLVTAFIDYLLKYMPSGSEAPEERALVAVAN
ncbi:MAG TPA: LysR family transcriptional regulator [Longimicrobiales bacterium]|nr:LysR family transcriptional regulator [Longimicrobiales bacterium]